MVVKSTEFSRKAGRMVRMLREKEGLTQAGLGERLDVEKQAVYAVEANRRRLTLDHLAEIFSALGYELTIVPERAEVFDRERYPVQNLNDVALRTREHESRDVFRHALRELYRYVGHTKDPLSILREPVSTGDPKRDAYLAGVAEGIARYFKWDEPNWVNRDRYVLPEPYFPGAPEGMKIPLWQLSPGYFRVRNIFVDNTAVVGPLEKHLGQGAEC